MGHAARHPEAKDFAKIGIQTTSNECRQWKLAQILLGTTNLRGTLTREALRTQFSAGSPTWDDEALEIIAQSIAAFGEAQRSKSLA